MVVSILPGLSLLQIIECPVIRILDVKDPALGIRQGLVQRLWSSDQGWNTPCQPTISAPQPQSHYSPASHNKLKTKDVPRHILPINNNLLPRIRPHANRQRPRPALRKLHIRRRRVRAPAEENRVARDGGADGRLDGAVRRIEGARAVPVGETKMSRADAWCALPTRRRRGRSARDRGLGMEGSMAWCTLGEKQSKRVGSRVND